LGYNNEVDDLIVGGSVGSLQGSSLQEDHAAYRTRDELHADKAPRVSNTT